MYDFLTSCDPDTAIAVALVGPAVILLFGAFTIAFGADALRCVFGREAL